MKKKSIWEFLFTGNISIHSPEISLKWSQSMHNKIIHFLGPHLNYVTMCLNIVCYFHCKTSSLNIQCFNQIVPSIVLFPFWADSALHVCWNSTYMFISVLDIPFAIHYSGTYALMNWRLVSAWHMKVHHALYIQLLHHLLACFRGFVVI